MYYERYMARLSDAGIVILAVFVLLGVLLCFFGFRLRRLFSAFIGLSFGALLGTGIKLSSAIGTMYTYNLSALKNRALDEVYNVLSTGAAKDDVMWIALPAVLAIVFCVLGAVYYRVTAGLYISLPIGAVVYYYAMSRNIAESTAILYALAATAAVLLLIVLLFNTLVVILSALTGSALLISAIISAWDIYIVRPVPAYVYTLIFAALFATGVVCQVNGLKKLRRRRSKRA